MIFRLYALQFCLTAREPIHFPDGQAANILRGAFGTLLRRTASAPEAYARIFEPASAGEGPSGFADLPRPFVFRAMHLDGRSFAPGERFHFDLNLFETKMPQIDDLASAFAQLAVEGLGPGRPRVELTDVIATPISLDLSERREAVSRVQVNFVTPTELKDAGQLCRQPEFGILAARARDRISKLRELYGEGPLELDFRAFGERAAQVRMTRCEIHNVDVQRRSSRTGQVHSLGGFVGSAEYEGNLAEFVPYLEAAQWTGVGRQTVWGKGQLGVVVHCT